MGKTAISKINKDYNFRNPEKEEYILLGVDVISAQSCVSPYEMKTEIPVKHRDRVSMGQEQFSISDTLLNDIIYNEIEKNKKEVFVTRDEIKDIIFEMTKNLRHQIGEDFKEIIRENLMRDKSGGEIALILPEDRKIKKSVFDYLHENAIEYEIIGGALAFSEADAMTVKYHFKEIPMEYKAIVSSEELDYQEVQELRKKKITL